jgi:hypothetical protein
MQCSILGQKCESLYLGQIPTTGLAVVNQTRKRYQFTGSQIDARRPSARAITRL